MSTGRKILLGLFLAALLAAVFVYAKLTAELYRKTEEVARLEIALSECGVRVRDADAAIERQNAAVDKTRVDTVYIDKMIKSTERKYVEVREVVIQSLEKDSGCENKVDNIDYALRRFHGAGVRSESRDEN